MIKSTTHDRFIVAAIIIIMAALLWIIPARAQDTEPPIAGATSSTLYLPAMANNWHAWYDDAELDAAMRRTGYDPATAGMHTVCTLDPTSVPPYLIRYTSCEQYLIGATPTEGSAHYIWYVRLGDNVVHGLEVGQ